MPESRDPVYPVLLAGGMGTRLWPVSRQLYPKQLVRFIGKESLVQATIKRLIPLVDPRNIRIVCGREHAHEIARHMRDVGVPPESGMIKEPCGRNTAPAILLAVLTVLKEVDDAILCIFPADHVIRNVGAFHEKAAAAIELAKKGYIVTFGIKPHYPETGYGYIEGADPIAEGALRIKRFVEKPDPATASQYVAAGRFYWNSGMFTFKASVMKAEFCRLQPELLTRMVEMVAGDGAPSLESYRRLENISIDYAVTEKTAKGVVLPSDFGWSDIGSWKSLYDFIAKDDHRNVALGDIIARNTSDSFIMGQSRLVAVNNIRNLAVVETADAVFVSDLERSRDVKSIVEELKAAGRQEYYQHGTVYHDWGSITTLEHGKSYAVDRLEILPGFTMAPAGDSESILHLVVVAGRVTVTAADQPHALKTGESTVVSGKDRVRVENSADRPASVIRVKLNGAGTP